jgi:hypothetical protein
VHINETFAIIRGLRRIHKFRPLIRPTAKYFYVGLPFQANEIYVGLPFGSPRNWAKLNINFN